MQVYNGASDNTIGGTASGSHNIISGNTNYGVLVGLGSDRNEVLGNLIGWCDTLAGLDGDVDGTANSEDCAPGNADAWTLPTAAENLFVGITGKDGMAWQAPSSLGGTSVLYDLLRSSDLSDFGGGACVETDDTDTVATDTTNPVPGEVYGYLIRVKNDCGGTLGQSAGAAPRSGGTCP